MSNTKKMIMEVCAENGITCLSLSRGYILRMTKNGQSRHVYGNFWDLNSAAADRLACDKCGCYALLSASGIPALAHTLVFNSINRGEWTGEDGTLLSALEFFEKHKRKIVIKPNKGTQGRDVFLCETPLAVEQALMTIFTTEPDAALSPYVNIRTEYRVFYLAGRAYFIYGKRRGKSWKFNLVSGATAFEVTDMNLIDDLTGMALRAARCIGINFATIDIAKLSDGTLAIVEINSGVMANRLIDQLPHLRPKIKSLFAEAIDRLFSQKRIAGAVGLQV
ncbi:MAG: ATP-grasp domain-containing protein [Defluviitaleaceae bacterium]|nr:ATP-grasp domain-containing protein [Defluviitaleaceae bacterium]